MTQASPSANSKRFYKRRNVVIALLGIGLTLIVVIAGIVLNSQKGGNGLVLVSGTANGVSFGGIEFINWNESENTRTRSAYIWFDRYEILLPGGHTYDVYYGFVKPGGVSFHFTVYVPLNVTAFTANFDPSDSRW